MDEKPFSVLENTDDILYVYDYTEPNFPEFDFSKYKNVSLLAFSYGVYASGIAKLPSDAGSSSRARLARRPWPGWRLSPQEARRVAIGARAVLLPRRRGAP